MKNIVQLIVQFGSVNSRNLSLLTELITKTIKRTDLSAEENWPQDLWSHRTSNFWICQSCFLSSNWYSECEHPFQTEIDKLMVITDEPAVQNARLLSLGSKLSPSNKQHMLTLSLLLDSVMQSLARVCQNRASEAKRALVVGCEQKLYSHDVKLKSSIQ